ncbi:MAG: AAA family ATPase [Vicinamibacterales bacterium]
MIQQISIRNFRHIAELDHDFVSQRALLIGANGSGKTSVFDALEWLLTGRCNGIDGRGGGAKLQIGPDGDTMEVAAVIDGLGAVTRSLSRGGSTACSHQQDTIYARLGTSDALIRAALHGERFFDLDHTAGKALLMEILNVTIPPKDLPALGPLPGPLGLAELDERYKVAYEDRAATKKALAALPALPDAVAEADEDGLAAARERLRAARLAEQAALEQKATAEATLQQLAKDATAAAVRVAALRSAREAQPARRARLDEVEAALAALPDDGRPELLELRAGAQVRLRQVGDLCGALAQHACGGACVLDAAIPCGTAAEAFAERRAALEADQSTIQAGLDALQRKIERANQVAEQRAALEAERAELVADDEGPDDEAIDDAEASQEALQRELAAARSSFQEAAASAEAATVAVDVEQETVSALDAAVKTAASLSATRARREKLTAKLEDLERQVATLGPKGVRVKAISAAVGRFEQVMASALSPFGFQIVFQIEPWKVFVQVGQAEPVPFVQLSRGFKVRVATAFALAIGTLSGLGFCVIDDADTIDPDSRKAFTELVMRASVPQVWIGMMKGTREPAPQMPGLQVLRMQGGSMVERIDPMAAAG